MATIDPIAENEALVISGPKRAFPDSFPCETCGEPREKWDRPNCDACVTKRRCEHAVRVTTEAMPTRYAWARIEAPELVERVTHADPAGRIMVAQNAPSVVLAGPAGSGKTSLAAAILVAMAARLGKAGVFLDVFDLVRGRTGQSLGHGEAVDVAKAFACPLLLLDELGAETQMRGTSESVVAEVVRERHKWMRPTIYTTAFGRDELVARYGDGVMRRVLEESMVIKLGDKQMRAAGGQGQ